MAFASSFTSEVIGQRKIQLLGSKIVEFIESGLLNVRLAQNLEDQQKIFSCLLRFLSLIYLKKKSQAHPDDFPTIFDQFDGQIDKLEPIENVILGRICVLSDAKNLVSQIKQKLNQDLENKPKESLPLTEIHSMLQRMSHQFTNNREIHVMSQVIPGIDLSSEDKQEFDEYLHNIVNVFQDDMESLTVISSRYYLMGRGRDPDLIRKLRGIFTRRIQNSRHILYMNHFLKQLSFIVNTCEMSDFDDHIQVIHRLIEVVPNLDIQKLSNVSLLAWRLPLSTRYQFEIAVYKRFKQLLEYEKSEDHFYYFGVYATILQNMEEDERKNIQENSQFWTRIHNTHNSSTNRTGISKRLKFALYSSKYEFSALIHDLVKKIIEIDPHAGKVF